MAKCSCKYETQCITPRMPLYGSFDELCMFVGEAPNAEEDKQGIPFVGAQGNLLRAATAKAGFDLENDFVSTNVMRCRPPNNKFPASFDEINPCIKKLNKVIKALNPRVIFAIGYNALSVLVPQSLMVKYFTANSARGLCIPVHDYNTWVVPLMSPTSIVRNNDDNRDFYYRQLIEDIKRGMDKRTTKISYAHPKEPVIITDPGEAEVWFEEYNRAELPVAFDYETTGLNPMVDLPLSISLYQDSERAPKTIILDKDYLDDVYGKQTHVREELYRSVGRWLRGPCPKVVTYLNMEMAWSSFVFGGLNNVIADTTVMSHIADQRRSSNSLDWRVLAHFGVYYKSMVDRENMSQEDILTVAKYGGYDAYWTMQLYLKLKQMIAENDMIPAHNLFRKAMIPYSNMTVTGMKLDKKILDNLETDFLAGINKEFSLMKELPAVQEWESRNPKKNVFKPTGRNAKKEILFDILEQPILETTATGQPKMDKEARKELHDISDNEQARSFLRALDEYGKQDKLLSYVKNLKTNRWPDGKVHPQFKLSTVLSYRSSCTNPNIQNQPHRGDGAILRKAFVPENDYFLAGDFGAMEVRVIAFYTKDPTLTEQLKNNYDMHSHWAERLYRVKKEDFDPKEWKDNYRFHAKNGFVFPLFYGSWHLPIAEELGLSYAQVASAEKEFWDDYKVVNQWQKGMIAFYKKHGYITLVNNFKIPGPLTERQIVNVPIQGTASHYIASAAVEIEDKLRGFESKMVAQIHDEILCDVKKEETKDVAEIMKECLEKPRFGIENVPLVAEFSIGKNWFDMESVEL